MAELTAIASQIRRDIVRMVHGASSGHPGGSLGCADFLTALYFKVMKHNPAFNMDARGEDVFFLSNGHISPLFYSALARSGYFDIKELATFRKLNSRLQGHPATHEHLPGVRIASGSLGQGMSVAIGAALTKRLNGENNIIYSRSAGVLHIFKNLPGLWPSLFALRLIPPFIRDGVYNFFARNRYKWFGKRDICFVPGESNREKFEI